MQKHILSALIGAALTLPLLAQAQGFYAGVNAGSAEQKLGDNIDGSISTSDTGYKLYGGYDFTKNVGLEAGYTDMGKSSFFDGSDTMTSKVRTSYVALTGTQVINTKYSLTGKVGVARSHVTLATYGESDYSKNQNSTLLGLGLVYHVSKKLSAVLEYEDFGKVLKVNGVNIKADLISVGLRYKF